MLQAYVKIKIIEDIRFQKKKERLVCTNNVGRE